MNANHDPDSSRLHLTMLAPADASGAGAFARLTVDRDRYEEELSEIQRFRGRVYLDDDALSASDLEEGGRHVSATDRERWHLALRDGAGRIRACMSIRYADPRGDLCALDACQSARRGGEGANADAALSELAARARADGVLLAETGGLAIAESHRGGRTCATIALSHYALCELVDHAHTICTAAAKNCSSAVLKRMGCAVIRRAGAALPVYVDPAYRGPVEMLESDSRRPPARFRKMIDRLRRELAACEVVTAGTSMAQAA